MTERDLHHSRASSPDEIRLINTLNLIKKNLDPLLKEIGGLLKKPYLESRQPPLESRFKGAVGKLDGIGTIERDLDIPDIPEYSRYQGIWLHNRNCAISKGYSVKSYDEYLEELAKRAKRIAKDP